MRRIWIFLLLVAVLLVLSGCVMLSAEDQRRLAEELAEWFTHWLP